MSQVPTATPAQAARRSIVAPTLYTHGPSLTRFLIVCASSAVINGGVLGVLFLITVVLGIGLGSDAKGDETPEVEQRTEVEETQKDFDLTNTDIGQDDSVDLNYNNSRL